MRQRVFGVDGWECPDCGKRMHLRTVVEGCRYFLRPPLALSRIERLTGADGRTVVRIGMKRMYSDGTHAIELTPQGREPSANPQHGDLTPM